MERRATFMATTKQVQLQEVNEDGSVTLVNPKNDARDISVGILTLGDATKIPGAEKNELLHTSLRNIAAHLYNIKDISKKLRTLSDSVADATDSTIPTSKVTAALNTRLGAAEATLTNHNTELGKRAPTMHAVNALTYGGGTGGVYGHVKLVDTYMTASVGGAASSIAASGNALYSAYNALNTAKANNNHAINGSTYGKGTSGVYGHVKTYDYNYTSAQGTSGIPDPVTSTDLSVVATQRALYSVWKRLSTKNTNHDTTIAGKAPTSHAVTSTTYGVGNTAVFGHLKLDNSYSSTSDEGNCGVTAGIAASSYAVRQAYSSLSSSIAGKLAASHATISSGVTATGKATGSSWGHTKLVDMGRDTAGKAAANGEAPSTLSIKAVWDAIKSAENTISTLNSKSEKLDPLIGSRLMRTKAVSVGIILHSVSPKFQHSSYAITDGREKTNYPFVGCVFPPTMVDGDPRFKAGDVYNIIVFCPVRHMMPIKLGATTSLFIEDIEVNYNHKALHYLGMLVEGDIGKEVVVTGGKTTWVFLGVHAVGIKETITPEFHATLTLDDIRLIKPKFTQRDVYGDPEGVSMPFLSGAYSSTLILDPRYLSTVPKIPVPDLTPGTEIYSTGIVKGFYVDNNEMEINGIVGFPDFTSYPMVCVEMEIEYRPPIYRHNYKETLTIDEVEVGLETSSTGVPIEGLSKRSRYVLYDIDHTPTDIYVLSTGGTQTMRLRAFFIPKYYGDADENLPDEIQCDAGYFMIRFMISSPTMTDASVGITTSPYVIVNLRTKTHPVTTLPYEIKRFGTGMVNSNCLV